MKINIPVSVGELVDKVTILEIKIKMINDKSKLKDVRKELGLLKKVFIKKNINLKKIKTDTDNLKKINQRLWFIEDKKRKHEKLKKFDSNFIKLARNVYKLNDKRAMYKFNINKITGSDIIEVKSYEK
tara:strand:- start:2406 stop:2789 length:384 start_codon:yes stop_codon:yes gene_type:complete